jgi:hypothetical protein
VGLKDWLNIGTKHGGQHRAGKHTKQAKAKAAKQPRIPKGSKGKGGKASMVAALLLTPPAALFAGAAGFAARTVL